VKRNKETLEKILWGWSESRKISWIRWENV